MPATAERNVNRIETRPRHEQRGGKMGDGADAAGPVIDLACFRVGDELGKRLGRDRRADSEDERPGAENADRNKILLRIVVDLLKLRHDRDLR